MNHINAMKQALEALEIVVVDTKTTPNAYEAHRQAITALRTAIERTEKQKPMAWYWRNNKGWVTYGESPHDYFDSKPLYTTQPAQPEPEPEPVQPVAWMVVNATPPGGYVLFQQYPQAVADVGGIVQPLYTTPPAQPAPVQHIEHCLWARNGNTPCPHTAPPAQPAVPEGWKLVPVKPTRDMSDAGGHAVRACYAKRYDDRREGEMMCDYIYRKMLEAAPEAPAAQPADHFASTGKPIPEGWKLVPVVPSAKMIEAGRRAPCSPSSDDAADDYKSVYQAMIAAHGITGEKK